MGHFNEIAGQKGIRVEALADGVFSIAMTLLAFDLKDPLSGMISGEESVRLREFAPKLLTFFMSFMTLGIFWVGHSTQFSYIRRFDRNLTWISLFFLMFCTLIPFSTSVLNAHLNVRFAIILYWLNLLAMGALLYWHWQYAFRKGYVKSEGNFSEAHVHRAITRRIFVAHALYTLGVIISLFHVLAGLSFILLTQLNFATGFIRQHKV